MRLEKSKLRSSECRFDHLVAIERSGRAEDGNYYNMRGINIKHLVDPIDDLFIAARTISGVSTTGEERCRSSFFRSLIIWGSWRRAASKELVLICSCRNRGWGQRAGDGQSEAAGEEPDAHGGGGGL